MSRRNMITVLVTVVVVFACTAVLAANNTLGIAEKRSITFSQPTVVGGTLLPAGNYAVTHEMSGQTHVMVFKQIDGKAEAKANCNLTPLKKKADQSQQIFTTNAKNERVLQQMTFSGDKATHVLVQ